MKNYYEILEVTAEATPDEIKAAYRKLALRYHPDKNPDDRVAEEHFKRVSEAYQILSDSYKRQLYDLYGQAGLAGLDLGGLDGFEDVFSSFGEAFEEFFSFGRQPTPPDQPQAGADLHQQVGLTLEQVDAGLEMSLEVERRVNCRHCGGSGAAPGTERQVCPRCRGEGQISQTKGPLKLYNTCPECQGKGVIIPSPCPTCQGAGTVQETKEIQVRIPPGVDGGSRLRLRGEGEAGIRGGPPGDLFLEVEIASHPVFERRERDLLYRAQISFVEATLGTEVAVPTLTDQTRLQIPPGTQPGATFRLTGLGLPGLKGKNRGDLIVLVDLKTPTRLTESQKKLLREFLLLAETGELDGKTGMTGVSNDLAG